MADLAGALQAAGRLDGAQFSSNYILIRCPFHSGGREKTPSCSVSLKKPVFFCHACAEGGHVTRLLKTVGVMADLADNIVKSMNFSNSYESGKNGPFAYYSGEDPFRGRYTLNEDLLDDYRLAPVDLIDAGFKQKTLKHFEVGFDYDNYRITFPIRNIYGELVGVSGRTVINAEPRYKLYGKELMHIDSVPEDYTMDSVKEAVLWHAHITYPFLWGFEEPVIITEGFKAAMWVWQCGYHNVVALIGAYCTALHAELLARTRAPVFLFLDNNEAGIKGTHRAIYRLTQIGANEIYCVRYPDLREQPDGLTKSEIDTAIKRSLTFNDWNKEKRNGICEDARKRQNRKWGIRSTGA